MPPMERNAADLPTDAITAAVRRLGLADGRVAVVYVAARRQLFAWREEAATGALRLRVNRVFRDAPPEVAESLVMTATRRARGAARRAHRHRMTAWFFEAAADLRTPSDDDAAGAFVDLRARFDVLRARRLPQGFDAVVAWSARPSRRVFGRFERGRPTGRIVVNRLLDAPLTPSWYVDFLLFHESLHALHPPRPGRGRMIHHPPEFRRAERSHPDAGRAAGFERFAIGPGRDLLLRRATNPELLPSELR